LSKWHYQDSPNDESPMPYTAAYEQDSIVIRLKGIDMNATESLAYNYFIPSQNLKNFIRYVCSIVPIEIRFKTILLLFRLNKIVLLVFMVQHIYRKSPCLKIL
jgi:hypothetical protein